MKPTIVLARLAPQSWDDESQTVDAILSTGAGVKRRDTAGVYTEFLDIDASTVADLPPLLDSHRTESLSDLLGRVFDVRKEHGKLIAKLHIDRPDIAARVRSGVIRDVSIGYSITGVTERTDPKTRVRSKTARVHVIEASLVTIPADPRAQVRNEPMKPKKTGAAESAPENEQAENDNTQTVAQTRAAIREIVRSAGGTPEQADELIDQDGTEEQARALAYDILQTRNPRAPRPRVIVGASHETPEALIERRASAIYARGAGLKPEDSAREFYGESMVDHARACLAMRNISTRGETAVGIVTRALQTTSDYPLILENVANKALLAPYAHNRSPIIEKLSKKSTLSDFKENGRYRVGEVGKLVELSEAGEFVATGRTESKNTISLKSAGRRIDYSGRLLVNDDMGALVDAPARFAEAAIAWENDEMIALFNANGGAGPEMDDGEDLWSSAHGNLDASNTPIEIESVSAAKLAMRKTVGLDGVTILDLSPSIMLVSAELEDRAIQFMSAYNAQWWQETNPHKMEIIVDPRLNAFEWFLFAAPSRAPVFETATLAGAAGPQVVSKESFDTWGVSFRCLHHFGAAAIGWRGAYKFSSGQDSNSEV
jgi:hypothetical protein